MRYDMSAGTLYTSSGSGNSYKVRLLAGILGIDLKHEEISLKVHLFLLLPHQLDSLWVNTTRSFLTHANIGQPAKLARVPKDQPPWRGPMPRSRRQDPQRLEFYLSVACRKLGRRREQQQCAVVVLVARSLRAGADNQLGKFPREARDPTCSAHTSPLTEILDNKSSPSPTPGCNTASSQTAPSSPTAAPSTVSGLARIGRNPRSMCSSRKAPSVATSLCACWSSDLPQGSGWRWAVRRLQI